ncbi:uncharacterized protein [Amphiura filiformis]|uniref:uncharacterized protein n=1 Tax=Amphiura filiformis TaxID=82378 RepID=UPI003B2288B5
MYKMSSKTGAIKLRMTDFMNFSVTYFVFFVTFIPMVTSLINQCSANFHVVHGKRMLTSETRTYNNVKMQSRCATSCLHDPRCLSFNFARNLGVCEMNSEVCLDADDRCNDDDDYAHVHRNGEVIGNCTPDINAQTPYVCEGDTFSLTCNNEERIIITSAMYGRQMYTLCPTTNMNTLSCAANNSLAIVQEVCDGKQSCNINASSEVFGDPCSGTDKYLQIEYECDFDSCASNPCYPGVTCTDAPSVKPICGSCPNGMVGNGTTCGVPMHLGCYEDNDASRILPDDFLSSTEAMTLSRCLKFCWFRNMIYAGIENSTDCWCGYKAAFDIDEKRPDVECSSVCSGNRENVCGGEWRINVYKLGERSCLSDWSKFEDTCYYLNTSKTTFYDALRTCAQFGGSMVSIHSQAEQDFVTGMISSTSVRIGLNDIRNESYFVWTDGTEVTFTAWSPGEPNGYGKREDCVYIADLDGNGTWTWNDHNCTSRLPFICKQRKYIDVFEVTTTAPPTTTSPPTTLERIEMTTTSIPTTNLVLTTLVAEDLIFYCPVDINIYGFWSSVYKQFVGFLPDQEPVFRAANDEVLSFSCTPEPGSVYFVGDVVNVTCDATFTTLQSVQCQYTVGIKERDLQLVFGKKVLTPSDYKGGATDIFTVEVGTEYVIQYPNIDTNNRTLTHAFWREAMKSHSDIHLTSDGLMTWRPTSTANVDISITITYDGETKPGGIWQYPVRICNCNQNSSCNFAEIINGTESSDKLFSVASCKCNPGYSGVNCLEDFDSCASNPCYPGVTCIDEPPPSVEYLCGSCPNEMIGNGTNCGVPLYLGCYEDNTTSRILPDEFTSSTEDMSLDTCIKFCWSKSMIYAGMENSTDCWCASEVSSDDVMSKIDQIPNAARFVVEIRMKLVVAN